MTDQKSHGTPKNLLCSFRDPAGSIIIHDNRVFRTVMPQAADDFSHVRKTPIIQNLIQQHVLLEETTVPLSQLPVLSEFSKAQYILEHPKLDMISYPYEWAFSMLKDATLLYLDIFLQSLEENVSLSDASAFNIQFIGSKPIFIDHLSFIPYQEGDLWLGHQQFYDQFLNPLLLETHKKIPHNLFYRSNPHGMTSEIINAILPAWSTWRPNIFFHVYLPAQLQKRKYFSVAKKSMHKKKKILPKHALKFMLSHFSGWIKTLQPATTQTLWKHYQFENNYSAQDYEEKKKCVAEFVEKTKVKIVWDLGCNTGDFAKASLKAGAQLVIGFDNDHAALEIAYQEAKKNHLNFTPLFLDLVTPSARQGFANSVLLNIQDRACADGLLSLALLHHLAIGNNIPLSSIIDYFLTLSPKGIIEFVPKTDPMVMTMLSLRKDIFSEYDERVFENILGQQAKIIKKFHFQDSQRVLYWYEK